MANSFFNIHDSSPLLCPPSPPNFKKPPLLSLPYDILISLPHYLRDIEDFLSLSSTSKALHETLSSHVQPKTILRLCASHPASNTFFRPFPHYLVAAIAPKIGAWVAQSESNAELFKNACQSEGLEGLLDLAIETIKCGLTMKELRELYKMKFSIINPGADLVDKCVGYQWRATPNFWDGGVDDAYTIDAEGNEIFFLLTTYGGLMAGANVFDDYLDEKREGKRNPMGEVATRLEFLKYCAPDWACYVGQEEAKEVRDPKTNEINPLRFVAPSGPYRLFKNRAAWDIPNGFTRKNDSLALLHVMYSSKWKPVWKKVRQDAGGDFEDLDKKDGENGYMNWKQDLWESIVWYQGLEGMGMISPDEKTRETWTMGKLKDWRNKIEAFTEGSNSKEEDHESRLVKVGGQVTYEFPDIKGDLRICQSGYVSGT